MENLKTVCVDDSGAIYLETVAVDVTLTEGEEEDEVCEDSNNVEINGSVLATLQDDSTDGYIPIPCALIQIVDGVQTIVAPDNFLDKGYTNVTVIPVDPNAELMQTVDTIEAPPVAIEANVFQLENGKYSFINTQMEDGCHVLKIEDGLPTLIKLQNDNSEEETLSTVIETTEIAENLQVDEKKTTKNNSRFRCFYPDCGRLYSTMNHLKVHERSHNGTRPYVCTAKDCNKAFATDYGRKSHERTHTGEKPYPCKEANCPKSFKTSGDLQKHIRTHTGERPFVCPVSGCDRSFTTSNIRKVHIRTHTGERPYSCTHPGCERSFASATNFKNHMRIHSGEKPFVCWWPLCQKRFTEYSSLYKHNMVHTKQKPYQCNLCNNNYRQVSTLTAHKRVAHGVIEAEDGTEIVLGEMLGVSGSKKLKNLANNLLSLSRDKRGTLVTLQSENGLEEQEQIYIFTGDNLDQAIHSIDEVTELEPSLDPLSGQ